jgi:hypothetical protein
MALYPHAAHKLLPESATQPRITPRAIILHSAAGRGSLYNFFKTSSSLESHFWVSERGVVEQYIDTERRADANRNANGFAISIETESSPQATEPWTSAQVNAIIALCSWLCSTHQIPRAKIPKWDGAGIGWHIQFGAPGPWTPVAKSCPGASRIIQVQNVIIPTVAKGQALPPAAQQDGILRPGDTGEAVKFLQAMLNIVAPELRKHGFGSGNAIPVDGIYGNSTTARVLEFEKYWNKVGPGQKEPLMQDGIFTQGTAEALAAIVKLVMA